MATVKKILETKGHDVHATRPDDMVIEALRLMKAKDIGAVLVMDGAGLVGIFTERHYTRNVFLEGKSSPSTRVGDVMERDVVVVTSEQTAEACMALMTKRHIRHLPVSSDGRIVGLVSMGDLMRSMIDEREFDIEQLVSYVRS
jgi:CBS domain-containing protein